MTDGKHSVVFIKMNVSRDFPGGPVISHPSNVGGMGSIPSWGTKILHVLWHGKKKKKVSGLSSYLSVFPPPLFGPATWLLGP